MSHAVHAFRYRGENIIFDGLTQSLLTVDDLSFEIIRLYPTHSQEEVVQRLSLRYPAKEIREAWQEIQTLVDEGTLFQDDASWRAEVQSHRPGLPLSGMCLNISHDCNLRCRYCFAGTGPYGQARKMMPLDVATQAIDWFLQASQQAKRLDVDFFGGEPLLNFPVIRQLIPYARKQGEKHGKEFHFSLTTNGTLLDDEILRFLNEQQINLIISLDGRADVHDRMRPAMGGQSSYQMTAANLQKVRTTRGEHMSQRYGKGTYTYIRGTFTRENLDFAADVLHIYEMGFDRIAMEPVSGTAQDRWAIRKEDVDVLLEQYDRLVDMVLEKKSTSRPLHFHHFEIDLHDGPCFAKRATGCGAGVQYIAVSPEGDLYPCHQFVGNESFRLGNVWSGLERADLQETFRKANTGEKEKCHTCFARYLCSGGCHANHWKQNKDLFQPDDLSCRLIRKRLECALYLLTQWTDQDG